MINIIEGQGKNLKDITMGNPQPSVLAA